MPKYTPFTPSNIIKIKSNSSVFSTDNAIVMGILNITDDSFYDGGKYVKEDDIENMLSDSFFNSISGVPFTGV